jgi:hypothetical protein
MSQNKNLVLVMGKPNTGKTTSLRNLPQEQMVYLNADLKETPFRDKFMASVEIADAYDVLNNIDEIEQTNDVKGAVLDTITFLMAMYERQYVINSVNTQAAWGAYGNFYRDLIHKIKAGTKDYAIMAHEDTVVNEETATFEAKVPIKGAVGKIGVEADFTTVLATKQMPVKKLEAFENDLLHITDEEREDGVKYVFVTRVTKDTAGSKMRSAMGLWNRNELYIDNDLKQVFDRLKSYYG